jgi:hypothetical protein
VQLLTDGFQQHCVVFKQKLPKSTLFCEFGEDPTKTPFEPDSAEIPFALVSRKYLMKWLVSHTKSRQ